MYHQKNCKKDGIQKTRNYRQSWHLHQRATGNLEKPKRLDPQTIQTNQHNMGRLAPPPFPPIQKMEPQKNPNGFPRIHPIPYKNQFDQYNDKASSKAV